MYLHTASFNVVKVVVELKEVPVPDGGHIVDQIAMYEALIKHGNVGLVKRDELTLNSDDASCE